MFLWLNDIIFRSLIIHMHTDNPVVWIIVFPCLHMRRYVFNFKKKDLNARGKENIGAQPLREAVSSFSRLASNLRYKSIISCHKEVI